MDTVRWGSTSVGAWAGRITVVARLLRRRRRVQGDGLAQHLHLRLELQLVTLPVRHAVVRLLPLAIRLCVLGAARDVSLAEVHPVEGPVGLTRDEHLVDALRLVLEHRDRCGRVVGATGGDFHLRIPVVAHLVADDEAAVGGLQFPDGVGAVDQGGRLEGLLALLELGGFLIGLDLRRRLGRRRGGLDDRRLFWQLGAARYSADVRSRNRNVRLLLAAGHEGEDKARGEQDVVEHRNLLGIGYPSDGLQIIAYRTHLGNAQQT